MIATGTPLLLILLAATPEPAADARRGEALFIGEARFANGGAPCLGCHGIAGHGLARAASFGPDLTGVHASLGAEALDAALTDVAFPSMAPLYAKHALTPAERADVLAFLQETSSGSAPAPGAGFAAGVAAIATSFLAASIALGRGRARVRRESP
jgi:mono/diheme cytochrome c family protein